MGVVIFNGRSSADYGIQVEHPPEYQTPVKDYEIIHIPGRNGDLVIDNGSYQNVSRQYQIAIGDENGNFTDMANRISEWLNSASGYARLEDSYEPEYYRMAMFQDEVSIENILQHAGRATIEFNCKPQRFLKSGEEVIRLYPDGSNTIDTVLYNPTGFNSLPRITVYGFDYANLQIRNSMTSWVRILNLDEFIVLDSETQDVYKDDCNRNSDIKMDNGFPIFEPGENKIFCGNTPGTISYVEVIPRWWTL